MNKVRFGIIGCSNIAAKSTIPAIKNSEFADLKMIGSSSYEKAKQFSERFNCNDIGSYQEVLDNNEIDAVYISLPIGLHEEWSIKAAKAGKHVLCEKSSTTSYDSALRMVKTCQDNNVRIMESFMFRFHPRHQKIHKLVHSNQLGNLFVFQGTYGFPPVSNRDIRYNSTLGGGVLNETGCYPICASRIIFNEDPIGVLCNLHIDEKMNIDTKGNTYISYKNKKAALISFSFESYYNASYKIWGSEGIIELERSYAIPPDLNSEINIKTNNENKIISVSPADHFLLMIDAFCKEIKNIKHAHFNFEEDLISQACIMECSRISNRENRFVYFNEISKN